jgi:hypothetical protein
VISVAVGAATAHAQVNVTTYHNDIARTGQNTQETILTPSNVNSSQFGKLFTVALDGDVYAEPLYLANVGIAGGTHNVLYAVTEHDSLYAIDADLGTVYWHISVIPSGGTTVNSISDLSGCTDIVPEIGITGTPVIDSGSGTIYFVAKSIVNGSIVQYLHAIDVGSSAEKFGGPVQINATVPGAAKDGNGTTVSFNAKWQNQRAALLLENGHVVIGWGSHCDYSPWHGWIMSYNASTLAQEAAWNSSPNGNPNTPDKVGCNGIWMAGSGVAADANGNLFFPTGNGNYNAGSSFGLTDYGDSVVRLNPITGSTLTVGDYFTPYNQSNLQNNDQDVGSGGLILLPTLPSGQQLLVSNGKQGTIYLLNRSNLGKYCPNLTPACTNSDPQIVQELQAGNGGTSSIHGAPAYWNGNLYWAGDNDALRLYTFNANNSGLLSHGSVSQTAKTFEFSTPTPSVSANGTTNGILWAIDDSQYDYTCNGGSNCQVLYAYDATNLSNLLYASNQAPNNRDVPGGAVKFATPAIANGKVYVGGQSEVSAFGLLGAVTATPTFSPAAGTYSSTQTVTLADATPGAAIYYTTNGSTPGTGSTPYVAPITVSTTTTVKAIAVAPGASSSAVASAVYTISLPTAAAPTFNPAAGTYSSTQTVTLADTTPGAIIYYTTNGSTPGTGSTVYTTPITVSATTTIQAIAVANGYTNSSVAIALYTITPPPPPSFTIGLSTASGTVAPGQSASTTVTLTPSNGFDQNVSLACSGLPAGAACNFSPAGVLVNGSAATSTLQITTTGSGGSASNAAHGPSNPLLPGPLIPGGILLVGFLVPLIRSRRQSKRGSSPHYFWLVVAVIGATTLQACGSGSPNGLNPDGSSSPTGESTFSGSSGSSTSGGGSTSTGGSPSSSGSTTSGGSSGGGSTSSGGSTTGSGSSASSSGSGSSSSSSSSSGGKSSSGSGSGTSSSGGSTGGSSGGSASGSSGGSSSGSSSGGKSSSSGGTGSSSGSGGGTSSSGSSGGSSSSSGGSSSSSGGGSTATPAGTYVITITATSGGTTHTTSYTLTVT